MSATAGKLSIGEEVYLRALTGRLVGIHLFKDFNKIAILTYPDRICESISAAAATAYLDTYGYGPGKVMVFDYSENIDEVAKKIVSWGAEAVYLAFGGEQRLALVDEVTKKSLKGLKAAGFKGSLLIHVRTWLATKQFATASSDPEILSYLRSIKEVRLFTADAGAKKMFFHRVNFDEKGAPSLSKYSEVEITQEHADLLKLSLPPP